MTDWALPNFPLPTKAFYLKGPKQCEEEKEAGARIRKKGKEGKREEKKEGGRKNENERTKKERKINRERRKGRERERKKKERKNINTKSDNGNK